ncbi:unannotated protein [freshwater metagenome]|uniref:Unannotated protein n=1 Tax=freshwater metagenome TaxID=449393 RepID=A0A6J7QDN3_9ZZZZ
MTATLPGGGSGMSGEVVAEELADSQPRTTHTVRPSASIKGVSTQNPFRPSWGRWRTTTCVDRS